MNNFDYKNMTPFKWFVLENFPFIENDFEEINNYRLFSKVVEYLNKTIDNVNVFGNLVEQFSDYFDNLDVQDEINNKLDKMVQSGELQALLSQQYSELRNQVNNTILEFENSTNSNLSSMNERINSVTSGSPAGVYATVSALQTADPDHSKIYVVSADGKWYYYDSTESDWVAGGTYQSTGIGDNQITYDLLNTNLQENLKAYTGTTGDYITDGSCYTGFVGETISLIANNDYSCGHIDVSTNDIVMFPFSQGGSYTVPQAILTDSNGVIVSRIFHNELFDDTNRLPITKTIKIPSGVTRIYFNANSTSSHNRKWYPYIITSYNYGDNRFTNNLTNRELLNYSELLSNVIYTTNAWAYTINNYKTEVYDVTPLEKIHINSVIGDNPQFLLGIFFDENNKPCGFVGPHGQVGVTDPTDVDVIVPPFSKKLYISTQSANTVKVYKYNYEDTSLEDYKRLTVNYTSDGLVMTNNENGTSITMKNSSTGNGLFMMKSYTVGNQTVSFETDTCPGPYIVKAVNNANGDRTGVLLNYGFTGGQHQWNNQSTDSTPTASQVGLSIYCDDTQITSGTTNKYCQMVKIIETNRVQASNTCLEAGGGRAVLEEKIIYVFDGYKLKIINTITPLEEIIIERYYGIQTAFFDNSKYKIYSDKIYDVNTKTNVTKKPNMIVGNNIIASKMNDTGLGDYRYNTSSGFKVDISNGKSYFVPVYNNQEHFTTADIQYIEGEYIFDSNQT